MRRWLPIAALVIALIAVVMLRGGGNDVETATVGRVLPEIMVTPLEGGEPRPLAGEVYGVTVVNIFASWCAPCRAEHPALMALRADGVRIVGLAWRDRPEAARAFLDDLGDPYVRVMADPEGNSDAALGLGGAIPHTLVLSERGEVLMRHAGPLAGTDGEAALAEIRRLAHEAR